jgi:hypothetical protein
MSALQMRSTEGFLQLDDYDIIGGIKALGAAMILCLSELCRMFIEMRLFNVQLDGKKLEQQILTT